MIIAYTVLLIKYSMRWIEKIMDLSLNISTNSDYDKFSSFSDQLDIIDLSIGQSTRNLPLEKWMSIVLLKID